MPVPPAARLLRCTGSVFLAGSVALRGQLAADPVKSTLGAPGPGARLLEHLDAAPKAARSSCRSGAGAPL